MDRTNVMNTSMKRSRVRCEQLNERQQKNIDAVGEDDLELLKEEPRKDQSGNGIPAAGNEVDQERHAIGEGIQGEIGLDACV